MKALPIAATVILFSLLIVAGAVFGLGDDEILVSPPEVVAEDFVRAVAQGRVGAARSMLTRDAESVTTSGDLRRLSMLSGSRFGRVDEVDGMVTKRSRDTTLVRVRIEGDRGRANPVLTLVREYGEWSVARALDVFDGPVEATTPKADSR